MKLLLIAGIGVVSLCFGFGCWLGWQLLRQNGRILLRLDELEQRLDEIEFGTQEVSDEVPTDRSADLSPLKGEPADGMRTELRAPLSEEDERSSRFSNRSLARSKIKRDGLKAGTAAPSFRLPRLDGGELSLEKLRGRRVLLVFSDPQCGPCSILAPKLEEFHRENGTKAVSPSPRPSPPGEGEPAHAVVVMISRGEPKENRQKVKEHGLTFLIVLQRQWEISRRYAMFATPVAYLIDEAGLIAHEVAVGVEPILRLLVELRRPTGPSPRIQSETLSHVELLK